MIATGVTGGIYMLLVALSSISFGRLVDRFRIMRFATAFALTLFLLPPGASTATAPTATRPNSVVRIRIPISAVSPPSTSTT